MRRVVFLFLVACGGKEEPRPVSEGTYAAEYAEAICSVQVDCDLAEEMEDCTDSVEQQWDGKLNMGCFDEAAARECLDILDTLTCSQYEDGVWSVCSDVADCSEV